MGMKNQALTKKFNLLTMDGCIYNRSFQHSFVIPTSGFLSAAGWLCGRELALGLYALLITLWSCM